MTTLIPKFDFKNGGTTPTGAVNRPINEKLGEFVSVADFGADNTGVSDSSTAFINAIASLPATGGTVYVPNGTYLISATINITKSVYFSLDAVTINFTVAPGINHTDKDLCIVGSGQTSSILTSNANGNLIYSASGAGTANSGLYKLSIDNIRLKDLLTTQTGTLFATWSTTRTAGAGIRIVGTPFNIKNVYTFGFFDSFYITYSVASTLESCWCFWSARHSFNVGRNCTSLTFTGTYSFAPQLNGYNLTDNITYCTFNSTASDSSGQFGYYLGPGPDIGFSPYNMVFNAIGCEEAGSLITTGASIALDGVRNIEFNEPFITGILQSSLANTTSGFATYNNSGNLNAYITINGGRIGSAAVPLGGVGINLQAGTCAGSITILTNPSEIASISVPVYDPDGVLFYTQGEFTNYVAAPSGSAVTLKTFSSVVTAGSYMVTTSVSLGSAAAWLTVDLITVESGSAAITNLKAGTGLTTSLTGMAFKATQSSGSAQTISCKILRIS